MILLGHKNVFSQMVAGLDDGMPYSRW